MRRRRSVSVSVTVTAAVLLVAGLAGCSAGGAPEAVTPPARIVESSAPAPAPAATVKPLARSLPVRVELPSAGVDARGILELGLNGDGTVEVPSVAQAERIGWYGKGVTPGETGPAVLIGHFDTARGPAVLKDVAKVRVGDTITVTRADGTVAVFRVRELEQVDKDAFPTEKVYGDTRRPELRLITCGGELVDGHRPDNIILYADLADVRRG
ncbi:class F sortase [Streptomyces sp. R302]|uniref:class F sortase n=1 Tax=unclassified Streptomyces TaxID=2593676 RepID=UPI00145CFE31|nr:MULTISPECIES: class F sortase [unclassified Streptomyces]NML50614.1 class F sortase [Streptomyces sp. R301]NML79605.1 class F sortase [Streptomyces sp. R302]